MTNVFFRYSVLTTFYYSSGYSNQLYLNTFLLSGICHSITLQQCINMTDYTLTSFPNFAGHKNQHELTRDLATYIRFFNESCYVYATSFFCSLLSPECKNGRRIPPCRKFCEGK